MKYLLWLQIKHFCIKPLEALLRNEIGESFEVKQLESARKVLPFYIWGFISLAQTFFDQMEELMKCFGCC